MTLVLVLGHDAMLLKECLVFSDVKRVDVGDLILFFTDVSDLFSRNFSTIWTGSWIAKSMHFALNLTMFC